MKKQKTLTKKKIDNEIRKYPDFREHPLLKPMYEELQKKNRFGVKK